MVVDSYIVIVIVIVILVEVVMLMIGQSCTVVYISIQIRCIDCTISIGRIAIEILQNFLRSNFDDLREGNGLEGLVFLFGGHAPD